MIYTKSKNTYFATPKNDVKDKISLEIGDSKQPDFKPQQKIMRWDNEVNVSLRLLHDELTPTVSKSGEKITWEGEKVKAEIYPLTEGEGGQEFEISLKEKPKSNVVQFTLVDKGVEYFYQSPLTDEEIKNGGSQPENVIGSYAIYISENKTNYVGGKEYKCGKVGHIYRPRIEDNNGDWVWGELHIEKGILSVTIPQDFLDKAVYPVRHAAGLTIGYTSVGSGTVNSASTIFFAPITQATDNGTMSKIQVATYNVSSGSRPVKIAIYNDNAGSPNTVLSNSYSGEITVTRTTKPTNDSEWASSTGVSGSIVSGNYYWAACCFNSGFIYVCADSGISTGMSKSLSYTSFPNTITSPSTTNYKYSIYATYTAGGGATGPANLKSYNTNLKANIKSINGNLIANCKSLNTNV